MATRGSQISKCLPGRSDKGNLPEDRELQTDLVGVVSRSLSGEAGLVSPAGEVGSEGEPGAPGSSVTGGWKTSTECLHEEILTLTKSALHKHDLREKQGLG